MHHPTDRITHTTAFVTPVVEHWLEREIAAVKTTAMMMLMLIMMEEGNPIFVSTYLQVSDTPAHGYNLWHGQWQGGSLMRAIWKLSPSEGMGMY